MTDDGLSQGYFDLIERVLLLAIKDAKAGNGYAADARAFLASRRARAFCEWLDADPVILNVFLACLPEPDGPYQLALGLRSFILVPNGNGVPSLHHFGRN